MSERFWSKVDRRGPDECWPWMAARLPLGYGRFRVSKPRRLVPSHRFAWELENGPMPDGTLACHTCDNPCCCNPRHIYAGTPLSNMQDMHRRGRAKCGQGSPRGSAHPCAKLAEADIDLIRMAVETLPVTQLDVARAWGVSPNLICAIMKRRAWAHV